MWTVGGEAPSVTRYVLTLPEGQEFIEFGNRAYIFRQSGRDEVYVRPFPDADSGQLLLSTNGGAEPVWAHSGRELF